MLFLDNHLRNDAGDAAALAEEGITYDIAPGVSTVTGSAAYAGFSLTVEAGIRRWLSGTGILKWGRWL